MKQRAISAIGVVLAGILPALFGGPIWAIAIAIFCLIGLFEYDRMARALGNEPLRIAWIVVPAMCILALGSWSADLALFPMAALVIGSAVLALRRNNEPGSSAALSSEVLGGMYLALPAFLAISTRSLPGMSGAGWLQSTAEKLSLGWNASPRGLAWLLLIITVTWLSDTGAYLVGRSFGKTKMFPAVSPNKTFEGLAGGIAAGVLFGLLGNRLFGLDLPLLVAVGVAAALVVFAVLGDLTESLLKRQAGVKDSGSLIPGHGGMLDRIDALLFTWMAGYFLARLCDRIWG